MAMQPLREARDIAPGGLVQIVRDYQEDRELVDATWWLLLDRDTLKPNYKYASFNSRSDKLNQPRSLAYRPYRESRCVFPVTAFVEGLGDKKTYHMIEQTGSAMALGGLYQTYVNKDTGEYIHGASVITVPPPAGCQHVYPKSMPLLLPADNPAVLDRWLDPEYRALEEFDELMQPKIFRQQTVTQIGKASQWNPIAASFVLGPDA